MSEPHERLKLARIRRGFADASSAASRFSWPYGTYSAHENGNRRLTHDKAVEYAAAFRVTPEYLLFGAGDGFSEPDAARFDHAGANAADVDLRVRALFPMRNALELWNIRSHMPAFGLREGDVACFDLAASPAPGDIVVANQADDHGEARTLIRRFEPGVLLSHDPSAPDAFIPIIGGNPSVAGVMLGMVRLSARLYS